MGSFSELKLHWIILSYQAEINNAVFKNECQIKDNVFSSNLSLLFIVSPLTEIEQNMINLPFYVAVVDENKECEDIQYYLISGCF